MRIRLKERCHIMGRIHEAGEIVELPDGSKGPHRTVRKSVDRIDYGTNPAVDANRLLGEMEDVPLYDVLEDETMNYPTLATETIVDRKGGNVLERQADAVLTHKVDETSPVTAGGAVATGDQQPEPAGETAEPADEIAAHNEALDDAEDHSG